MKTRYSISLACLMGVAAYALAVHANAQRTRPPKVTSLQATSDKKGEHPAKAEIAGPAPITCINAASETPNSQPVPSCHITAPGFSGKVVKGHTVKATGAGTVILTCNGAGVLRCNARIN